MMMCFFQVEIKIPIHSMSNFQNLTYLERELLFGHPPQPTDSSTTTLPHGDPSVEVTRPKTVSHDSGGLRNHMLLSPMPRYHAVKLESLRRSVSSMLPDTSNTSLAVSPISKKLSDSTVLTHNVGNSSTSVEDNYIRARSVVRKEKDNWNAGFVKRTVAPKVELKDFGVLIYIQQMAVSLRTLTIHPKIDIRHYDLSWIEKPPTEAIDTTNWVTVQDIQEHGAHPVVLNSPRSIWLSLYNGISPAMLHGDDVVNQVPFLHHPEMINERRRFNAERRKVETLELQKQHSEMCSQISRESIVEMLSMKASAAANMEKETHEKLSKLLETRREAERQKMVRNVEGDISTRKTMLERVREKQEANVTSTLRRVKRMKQAAEEKKQKSQLIQLASEKKAEKLKVLRVERQSQYEEELEVRRKHQEAVQRERIKASEQRLQEKKYRAHEKEEDRKIRLLAANEATQILEAERLKIIYEKQRLAEESTARLQAHREAIKAQHAQMQLVNKERREVILVNAASQLEEKRELYLEQQQHAEQRLKDHRNHKKLIFELRQHNELRKEYHRAEVVVEGMRQLREEAAMQEAQRREREKNFQELKDTMEVQRVHVTELSRQKDIDKLCYKFQQKNKSEFDRLRLHDVIQDKSKRNDHLKQLNSAMAQSARSEWSLLMLERESKLKQLQMEQIDIERKAYFQRFSNSELKFK
eukprot:PhF_6_TR21006/c0_g1_i1/m.30173